MTIILIILTLPFLAEGSSQRPNAFSPALREPMAGQRRDLASEVRTILSVKCAECHSANLPRPKGMFGHVEDLKRVVSDPKFVVPFRPEESKLWQLIQDNEMPPKQARAGPLTAKQKSAIRTWIEHLLGWLGKFHVLIVHFPIALLVVAAVGELWSVYRGIRDPAPAVRLCVFFAAAGAAAATLLGWLHAAFSGYATSSSQVLALHRWSGTMAGVLAVVAAMLSEIDARRGVRSPLFRVLLFGGALLVSVAGHLGGTLVYGDSYFNW